MKVWIVCWHISVRYDQNGKGQFHFVGWFCFAVIATCALALSSSNTRIVCHFSSSLGKIKRRAIQLRIFFCPVRSLDEKEAKVPNEVENVWRSFFFFFDFLVESFSAAHNLYVCIMYNEYITQGQRRSSPSIYLERAHVQMLDLTADKVLFINHLSGKLAHIRSDIVSTIRHRHRRIATKWPINFNGNRTKKKKAKITVETNLFILISSRRSRRIFFVYFRRRKFDGFHFTYVRHPVCV